MKIALDAMGGDLAPQATVQGAMNAMKHTQDELQIILIGNDVQIQYELGESIPKGIMNSIFFAQKSIKENLIQDISKGIDEHLGAIS